MIVEFLHSLVAMEVSLVKQYQEFFFFVYSTGQLHAARSGHSNFSESAEEIKPLTEEEKKQQLEKYGLKFSTLCLKLGKVTWGTSFNLKYPW